MLTFLAPSGLLALLGVAVPVAIHLWNRRPGRVVQVGSIRWLTAAANRRLRNLKLEQLALLLLRALLVVMLALAVAGPVWRRPAPPRRGQVLISADLLNSESLAAVRPTIDSLRRRGFTLRQLRQGFPRISDTVWQQKNQPVSVPAAATANLHFWPRVAQAADSFPHEPVWVYTSTTQRHFAGSRPALPTSVRWQAVPLPAPAIAWLSNASLTTPDSLRLVGSRGTDEAVFTTSRTVARPRQSPAVLPRVAGLPPLHYHSEAGRSVIRVAMPTDTLQVPVLAQPMRVWLYHDAAYAPDARYLQAALRAAGVGLLPRLELTVSRQLPPDEASLNWLFWLHSSPIPTAWQQRARQGLAIWQSARGPGVAQQTVFGVNPAELTYSLTRLDTTSHPGSRLVWQAATGRPVLSCRTVGRGAIYQFHSRLHPAWGTLVDSPELPELLLSLLQPSTGQPAEPHDPRQLDAGQVVRQEVAPADRTSTPSPAPTDTDLRAKLVLLAAVLWALERGLAQRFSAKPTSV
ncbi:BatA domain-containing protein [Hymenobacter metallicola]|uniref:BatA domain-containing protein n=1 Tax=Hymenobacter metallicola TaxID=2563114 RepID=UPI001436A4BC|nr:BatA domain-containing protein [Hymenobacter metallicola]